MDASQKQEAIKVLSDRETVKKVTDKAFADIDTDHSGFTERGEPAKAANHFQRSEEPLSHQKTKSTRA